MGPSACPVPGALVCARGPRKAWGVSSGAQGKARALMARWWEWIQQHSTAHRCPRLRNTKEKRHLTGVGAGRGRTLAAGACVDRRPGHGGGRPRLLSVAPGKPSRSPAAPLPETRFPQRKHSRLHRAGLLEARAFLSLQNAHRESGASPGERIRGHFTFIISLFPTGLYL